jgi:hypothetical protein
MCRAPLNLSQRKRVTRLDLAVSELNAAISDAIDAGISAQLRFDEAGGIWTLALEPPASDEAAKG